MYNLMNNLMKLFLSIWLLSAVTLTAAKTETGTESSRRSLL